MKLSHALSAAIAATLIGGGILLAGLVGSEAQGSVTLVTPGTHDCTTAPNPVIDASGATFKIIGTCERILVRGNGNKIDIEAGKSVEVNGARNVVKIDAVDKARLNGARNTICYKRAVTG